MSSFPAALQVLLVLGLLLSLGAMLTALIRQRRGRRAALHAFAAREGLRVRTLADARTWTLDGWYRDKSVHLKRDWATEGPRRALRTDLRLEVGVRLPPGLRLHRDGPGTPLRTLLGEPDIRGVEPRIDESLVVQGPERQARILLRDAPLRTALVRWMGRYPKGRIADDAVQVELPEDAEEWLETSLGDAARLADAFADAVRRLVEPDPTDDPGASFVDVRARLSEEAPQATVARWRVAPGDHVERADALCELLTHHGTQEVAAPVPGIVTKVLRQPGDLVTTGDRLAALRPDAGVSVPAQPAPPNPSGLELLDLDLVDLHPQERALAARPPRLDIDSPRPPGVPSRPPEAPAPEPLGWQVPLDPGDRPTDPDGVAPPPPGDLETLRPLLARLAAADGHAELVAALLAPHADTVWRFELSVTSVRWTVALGLSEALRRGRTVVGRIPGHDGDLAVRLPDRLNASLDAGDGATAPRPPLAVVARLVEWDDLYKLPVFHAG